MIILHDFSSDLTLNLNRKLELIIFKSYKSQIIIFIIKDINLIFIYNYEANFDFTPKINWSLCISDFWSTACLHQIQI